MLNLLKNKRFNNQTLTTKLKQDRVIQTLIARPFFPPCSPCSPCSQVPQQQV